MRMTFLPSGEKRKPWMPNLSLVSCFRSVPSGFMLQSCPSRMKAIFLSALNPGSISFALGIRGQCLLVLAVGIHDEEHLMTLVLLYTVVTHLVHHLLAVRRSFGATDSSHCPKSLRGHQVVFYLDVVFLNHSLCISCCAPS